MLSKLAGSLHKVAIYLAQQALALFSVFFVGKAVIIAGFIIYFLATNSINSVTGKEILALVILSLINLLIGMAALAVLHLWRHVKVINVILYALGIRREL